MGRPAAAQTAAGMNTLLNLAPIARLRQRHEVPSRSHGSGAWRASRTRSECALLPEKVALRNAGRSTPFISRREIALTSNGTRKTPLFAISDANGRARRISALGYTAPAPSRQRRQTGHCGEVHAFLHPADGPMANLTPVKATTGLVRTLPKLRAVATRTEALGSPIKWLILEPTLGGTRVPRTQLGNQTWQ